MRIVNTCHYAKLPENHPTWQRAINSSEIISSNKVNLTSEELLEFVNNADALITGTDFIKKDLIEKFPKCLKVISRPAVGYDRVDIGAAKKMGIKVCNAPGSNTSSVADLTFGLLISCARWIPENVSKCKNKIWETGKKGTSLYNKVLGILGLGAVGKAVALRAKGFEMKICAYDPYIDYVFCDKHNIKVVSIDELLAQSDFITLHLPLLKNTDHIIDLSTIDKMKDGVILINAARGGLIDHDALYSALSCGKIRCYGADVMEPEPPGDHPLLKLDNVFVTPHIGAHTTEALENMIDIALTNALDILEGKSCKNIVNL